MVNVCMYRMHACMHHVYVCVHYVCILNTYMYVFMFSNIFRIRSLHSSVICIPIYIHIIGRSSVCYVIITLVEFKM